MTQEQGGDINMTQEQGGNVNMTHEHMTQEHRQGDVNIFQQRKRQRTDEVRSAPVKWTEQEDEELAAAVTQHGARQWKLVASCVPTRSHAQCLQRWAKVLKPGLKKGQWTIEEDMRLTYLLNSNWTNWSLISAEISGRTSKQSRERWFHHLDPSINRSPFSAVEDSRIISAQTEIGGRWAKIAKILSTTNSRRTSEAIKIRFKTLDRHGKSGATFPCPQITRRRQSCQYQMPNIGASSISIGTAISSTAVADIDMLTAPVVLNAKDLGEMSTSNNESLDELLLQTVFASQVGASAVAKTVDVGFDFDDASEWLTKVIDDIETNEHLELNFLDEIEFDWLGQDVL